MNNYTFNYGYWSFKRVIRKTAEKAFNHGLSVIICPVNLCPFTMWHCELTINKNDNIHFDYDDADFNKRILYYEAYNCINAETGKYTAFYIPVCDIDAFTGEKATAETINRIESYDYSYMTGTIKNFNHQKKELVK